MSMILETERLFLREMDRNDYDALYRVLPEIGYHIRRDFQRRGYAKEAAKAERDRRRSHESAKGRASKWNITAQLH